MSRYRQTMSEALKQVYKEQDEKDHEISMARGELEVGQNYHINKEEFHRLHKGNSDLKLEIKEYD